MYFFNGQSVKTSMGIDCLNNECNTFVCIHINDELDHISTIYVKTQAPKFNFKYISMPVRKTDKIRIELWRVNMASEDKIAVASLLGVVSSLTASTIRFAAYVYVWSKIIQAVRGGSSDEEVKVKLLSHWSVEPITKIVKGNRLSGKKWDDNAQNIIFYNATWTPISLRYYPHEVFEEL